MSRAAARFFLTPSLLPLPFPKWQRRRRSCTCTTRALAMAASGFGGGGEAFRLSVAAGAGALKLHKGDITRWCVDGAADAIVNAANEQMLGDIGGVDGAIHRAAGPELLEACRKVPQVKPGVRCPTGEARITPAFKLPVSRVIHTVGPIYDMDKQPEVSLKNAYENSLKLAKENGIQYIAFPAISCGIYRYPFKEASQIAVSTAQQFSGDITEVHFVLFSDELYNIWLETAQEMLPQIEPLSMADARDQDGAIVPLDEMHIQEESSESLSPMPARGDEKEAPSMTDTREEGGEPVAEATTCNLDDYTLRDVSGQFRSNLIVRLHRVIEKTMEDFVALTVHPEVVAKYNADQDARIAELERTLARMRASAEETKLKNEEVARHYKERVLEGETKLERTLQRASDI